MPGDGSLRDCTVCGVPWFRLDLTDDPTADRAAIEARVPAGARWAAVFHPLLVDVPDGAGKRTETLDGVAFVYLP